MTAESRLYDVILDVPSLFGRRFTYRHAGEVRLPKGAKVRVPFGPSARDAFVVGPPSEEAPGEVKDIKFVYDLRFLPSCEMLSLSEKLAAHYCTDVASFWSCLWPPIVPRDPGAQNQEDVSLSSGPARDVKGTKEAELVWGSRAFRWAHYQAVIVEALNEGAGVLVLVAETKQLKGAALAAEEAAHGRVMSVHSDMTGLARRDAWLTAMTSEGGVVVGTRSAIFASVPHLGAIIVDEEWSDSHKSPESPFYDARTVARMRADSKPCKIVFGSSHPSLRVFKEASEGRLALHKEVRKEFSVIPVDLHEKGPRRTAISPALGGEMERVFASGQRAFMFLNKRGDSSQVTCQECGETLKCPQCRSPLTYHSKERSLHCHTCGYREASVDTCPNCGGSRWRFLGFGVEKAALEISRRFPDVPLFRIDKDSIAGTSVDRVLSDFRSTSPSCLLGTRLSLGMDGYPPVSLTGVLSGDALLSAADFRSGERVFHTLWHLHDSFHENDAGPGTMVVQTYDPYHHAVRGLTDQTSFYEEELLSRKMLGYPPFKALFKVTVSGKNVGRAREVATSFRAAVSDICPEALVLGPIPSPKPKLRGAFRFQLALRHESHGRLAEACAKALFACRPPGSVRIALDADPVDMS